MYVFGVISFITTVPLIDFVPITVQSYVHFAKLRIKIFDISNRVLETDIDICNHLSAFKTHCTIHVKERYVEILTIKFYHN